MEGRPIDPPYEILVDRFVPFIDEIAQVIYERGDQPLAVTVASSLRDVPPSQRQRAMHEVILRYRDVVEEPAAAIVRKRKALRPSAVEKLDVAFSCGDGGDHFFYREALDGVEIELVDIARPPKTSHLALRVSWPPSSSLRNFPQGGLVISTDRNMLVLFVGPYRPGLSSQGFYLVYDAQASCVAVIPPLLSLCMFSHSGIGTGGAILFHGLPGDYLLVELFRRRSKCGRTSNKATLFRWWSSGAAAGRWTQKEVMLPLPSESEEHTSRPSHTFSADTVFTVGNQGLCWVDLLQGVLICDYVLAAEPQFRYIPLPMVTIRAGIECRGQPVAHRSMCCVERGGDQILKFVMVKDYGENQDHKGVTITSWTTPVLVPQWKMAFSFRFGELESDSALELPWLMPTYPMLSIADDSVMYITMAADLESTNGRPEDRGRYVLSLDTVHLRIFSSFKLPTTSGRIPIDLLATTAFSCYLHKTSLPSEVQHKRLKKTGSSSFSTSTSAV